mgnify:FL=1
MDKGDNTMDPFVENNILNILENGFANLMIQNVTFLKFSEINTKHTQTVDMWSMKTVDLCFGCLDNNMRNLELEPSVDIWKVF